MKPFFRIWILDLLLPLLLTLLPSPAPAGDKEADLKRAEELNAKVMECIKTGKFKEGVPLAKEVIALREKHLGPEHPDVATGLNNLAMLLDAQGDYSGAKPLYERALKITEKALGVDHPRVATGLNNLAEILRAQGDYAGAKPLYERALKILEKALGAEHPQVATGLNNLAGLLESQGDYAGAKPLYERALKIDEKALGPDHPDVAIDLNNLAGLLWAQKEVGSARKLMSRGFGIVEKMVDNLLDVTSERERIELVRSQSFNFSYVLSLFTEDTDGVLTYPAALRWKGVVQNTLAAQRTAMLGSREPGLKEKFSQLALVRRSLATLTFMTPKPGQEEERLKTIKNLTEQKEVLERELSQKSREFRAEKSLMAAGLKEVCAQVHPAAALVDYLRYDRYAPPDASKGEKGKGTWTSSYLVFVLVGGVCEQPVRVELGPVEEIDKAVAEYRSRTEAGKSAKMIDNAAARVRELVWDKLIPHLGGKKWVWVVPDGSLSGVPFGALPEKGGYLLESYTFGYLGSATDLVRLAQRGDVKAEGTLLAGGIDYDLDVRVGADPTARPIALATRSAGCGPESVGKFEKLDGTGPEVEAVKKAVGKEKALVLKSGEATEEEFKKNAPGKKVIHLATHGFFAGGKCKSALDDTGKERRGTFEMEKAQVTGFNPMVLSGVVFAGVNAKRGATTGDDGILTAEEVAAMDLRGTELVVLSACETGLGEVKAGEGVMGLRRAFALAGAKSLVMSLWKVPDDETRQLMTDFYAQLAKDPKLDKPTALRNAQLKLIAEKRKKDGEAHPWLWAGFIAAGR